MRSMTRMTASAALGGLVLLCLPASAARRAPQVQAVTHVASLAPGSILGTVQDENGAPVAGAMVSAFGATIGVRGHRSRADVSSCGRLPPGPYLVRAHSSGFIASRGQIVDVRSSARSASSIALRHSRDAGQSPSYPIAAAGIGALVEPLRRRRPRRAGTGGSR